MADFRKDWQMNLSPHLLEEEKLKVQVKTFIQLKFSGERGVAVTWGTQQYKEPDRGGPYSKRLTSDQGRWVCKHTLTAPPTYTPNYLAVGKLLKKRYEQSTLFTYIFIHLKIHILYLPPGAH